MGNRKTRADNLCVVAELPIECAVVVHLRSHLVVRTHLGVFKTGCLMDVTDYFIGSEPTGTVTGRCRRGLLSSGATRIRVWIFALGVRYFIQLSYSPNNDSLTNSIKPSRLTLAVHSMSNYS